MNNIDRTGKRRRTEVHGRRAAHDLGALDVVQTDRLYFRYESSTCRNSIDEHQQVIHLAHSQQAGHRTGRTGIAAWRDGHATKQRQSGSQVVSSARAYFLVDLLSGGSASSAIVDVGEALRTHRLAWAVSEAARTGGVVRVGNR